MTQWLLTLARAWVALMLIGSSMAAGWCIGVYMGPRMERGEGEEQGNDADDYESGKD